MSYEVLDKENKDIFAELIKSGILEYKINNDYNKAKCYFEKLKSYQNEENYYVDLANTYLELIDIKLKKNHEKRNESVESIDLLCKAFVQNNDCLMEEFYYAWKEMRSLEGTYLTDKEQSLLITFIDLCKKQNKFELGIQATKDGIKYSSLKRRSEFLLKLVNLYDMKGDKVIANMYFDLWLISKEKNKNIEADSLGTIKLVNKRKGN